MMQNPAYGNLLINTGAPGAIPTRDLPLRRRTLYATELREHKKASIQQTVNSSQQAAVSNHEFDVRRLLSAACFRIDT